MLLALATVELPYVNAFKKVTMVNHSIALPHMVWAALYKHSPAAFEEHMMPNGKNKLPAFWQSMSAHPALKNHPMLAVDRWRDTFIPVSVHGDGVPVTGIGRSWAKGVEAKRGANILLI